MSAAVPNNATLANQVEPKELSKAKKHLEHVPLDKAPTTLTGGKHVDPGKKADFAAGAVLATTGGANEAEARAGEVKVQSSVVIDTLQESKPQASAEIQALLSRLSTTATQVDEYSRRQSEQISAESTAQIQRIIAQTQQSQDALLRDASIRSQEIEAEYNNKLKQFLQELDASKASNLASLEKDLSFRQEQLLANAKEEMDRIYREAMLKRMSVMQRATDHAVNDVDRLTEQVRALGEQEVERRLASTTTTVITTQVKTEANETIADGNIKPGHTLTMDKSSTHITETNAERVVRTSEPRANVRI